MEDPVLPYEWGESAGDYFEHAGANVTFYSYNCGHTVTEQNQHDFKDWLLEDLKK